MHGKRMDNCVPHKMHFCWIYVDFIRFSSRIFSLKLFYCQCKFDPFIL